MNTRPRYHFSPFSHCLALSVLFIAVASPGITAAQVDTDPPARCLGQGVVQSISLTDWDGGIGSWTVDTHDLVNPALFNTPDWAVVSPLPDGRAGSAAFVSNPEGNCVTDHNGGVLNLDSPKITIPSGTVVPRLSIDHWVDVESEWDGGNLKISVNEGPFTLVPASAFEIGPYDGQLRAADAGNDNPLAGEVAFTGGPGAWGQSHLNLTGIAAAGDKVILRFDFGQDRCAGATGWYVDEVEFYSCSLETLCGNSVLDAGEQCDDGNAQSGDGCSSSCQIEDGWECSLPSPLVELPDHSFEAGPDGGFWTESSINFGTPICNEDVCGLSEGIGASDGEYWAWLGGIINEDPDEIASVSQSVTVPSTAISLAFDFALPWCDSANDFMQLRIDGNVEYSVNGVDGFCYSAGYEVRKVDITAYADGAVHSIEFYSESFATNGDSTNFFVDNVVFPATPSVCSNGTLDLIFADGFED